MEAQIVLIKKRCELFRRAGCLWCRSKRSEDLRQQKKQNESEASQRPWLRATSARTRSGADERADKTSLRDGRVRTEAARSHCRKSLHIMEAKENLEIRFPCATLAWEGKPVLIFHDIHRFMPRATAFHVSQTEY